MKSDDPHTQPDKSTPPQPTLDELLRMISATTDQPRAEKVTSPHGMAAETLAKLTATDATALSACLVADAKEINGGALSGVEGKLASQATTLNALFHRLTQIAFKDPLTMEDFSGYIKLALKAQAQSAHTLEVLGNLKQGPRIIVAKQLNAAHQQIVNNGTTGEQTTGHQRSRRAKNANLPVPSTNNLPEPSPFTTYAPLDTRSPREATPEYSPLEPMDEVHRPAQRERKADEQPEC